MSKKGLQVEKKRGRSKGFTLIEVLIVSVIIAVLAAIAYPAYTEYTRNARRAEARATLTQIIQLQERRFTQNNAYQPTFPGTPAPAGWPVTVGNPASPFYTISWTTVPGVAPAPDVVTVRATPAAAFSDPKCNILAIDTIGNKTVTGATQTAAECWTR
jgi:type IV pilus assembly protein PilE